MLPDSDHLMSEDQLPIALIENSSRPDVKEKEKNEVLINVSRCESIVFPIRMPNASYYC